MPSPSRIRWAKLRVTAVTIVAVLIMGTLAVLLTGGTLLEEKTTLYLHIPDATGLASGSPVRVDGIGVGKVEAVRLSGSNEPNRVVRLAMTIERNKLFNIPRDSYAQISSDTLVGDKFVDITSGRSPAAIRPDGELTYRSQPDLTKTLDLSQFEQQLRQLDALLTDIEQGRSELGQFIIGEQMYDDFRKRFAQIESTLRRAVDATHSVGQFLYSDRVYRQFEQPLLRLDQNLARLQSGQGAAAQFLRDSGQYDSFNKVARDLRESIAQLRASELIQSDSHYADWNRRITALIQMVDDFTVTPLLSTPAEYDNLNGFARELQKTVRDFREDPRKFLRLKIF
jgi:phospholipid/cholesterol/gamma-HCH transport system substrate-binding protein